MTIIICACNRDSSLIWENERKNVFLDPRIDPEVTTEKLSLSPRKMPQKYLITVNHTYTAHFFYVHGHLKILLSFWGV